MHRDTLLAIVTPGFVCAIAREVLVPLANGASVPLGLVAGVRLMQGPASIRSRGAESGPRW